MRLFAALLAAALLAGCSSEADFSEAIETEILSAEEYQQEIASIDRLLFREEALGEGGVRELENIIDGLSKRVGAHSDSKFIKIESLELKLLAKKAGRLSPKGTGAALQNDWMRLRNNLFDDRSWFVRSAADLEYAASVVPPPAPPPAPEVARPKILAPEIEQRFALTGKWRVVSIAANGEPREDEELTGSVWTFDAPRLVMRQPDGPEAVFNFIPEGEFLRVSGTTDEEGWMRYELLAAGELRVAFHDGLGDKPPGFEHDPTRKDPMLLVIRLAAMK